MPYIDPIPSSSIPDFLATLLTQSSRKRIPSIAPSSPTFFLVPLIISTTLGHAHHWLPHIYKAATHDLPPSPLTRSSSPRLPKDETNERRLVVRQMKEALTKTFSLIGAPRAIEALLELNGVVDDGDKDDSFVREEFETRGVQERADGGLKGIRTIYKDDIGPIFQMMQTDLKDIRWLSQNITYGTFLTPHASRTHEDSPDPLAQDLTLLSIITLSAIVPQRTPREILWHLRGAIRRGMTRSQVGQLHKEIELVCEACGLAGVREGMPRVDDVEKQPEEE